MPAMNTVWNSSPFAVWAVIIRTPSAANVWAVGTHVKHKVFGEGVIEEVDALTQTYMIRFLNGIKPIRFGYQGMAEV
jgi:hypothetical protein